MSGSLLPHDLTPWGMFQNADIVVQSILVGLFLASIATWTIWLAKTIEIVQARWTLARAVQRLRSSRTISDLAGIGAQIKRNDVADMLAAAAHEREMSGATSGGAGMQQRLALLLQRIEEHHARRMMRGTGILATVGSIAPFVGLFGTVWGIMNSFIGISKLQTTNLAVVAPGIAEALLATAIGLGAAIPAVVIYNVFSRLIAGYRSLLGDATAEIRRIVSRDADLAAKDGNVRLSQPVAAE